MEKTLPATNQRVNGSNNEVTQDQKGFHMFCRACNFEQFVFQILMEGRHGSHMAYSYQVLVIRQKY